MWAAIVGVVGSALAVLLWWLNNTPARKHMALLQAIAQLKGDYAQAIARGDAVAAAECQRRLRDVAIQAGRSIGE